MPALQHGSVTDSNVHGKCNKRDNAKCIGSISEGEKRCFFSDCGRKSEVTLTEED